MNSTKIPSIEVDQILYVSISGWIRSEPKLHEFKITRFNKSSIYAKQEGSKIERRFNRRTLVAHNGLGDRFQAYFDPQEYWGKIDRSKQVKELRLELTSQIDKLKLEKLQAVKEFITSL